MGAFKSVWTQAAVYPAEAQAESGVVFGPNGDDFTGTLVVGGGIVTPPEGFEVKICVNGINQDGEILRIKQGSDANITVLNIPFTPTGDLLLGVRDCAGRWLLKVAGSFAGTTATFQVQSKDAMDLYEGKHRYDVFNVDGYDAETGDYANAQFLLGGEIIALPLNLRLEV